MYSKLKMKNCSQIDLDYSTHNGCFSKSYRMPCKHTRDRLIHTRETSLTRSKDRSILSGAVHYKNLWRGGSISKEKSLGGQPGTQFSKYWGIGCH